MTDLIVIGLGSAQLVVLAGILFQAGKYAQRLESTENTVKEHLRTCDNRHDAAAAHERAGAVDLGRLQVDVAAIRAEVTGVRAELTEFRGSVFVEAMRVAPSVRAVKNRVLGGSGG